METLNKRFPHLNLNARSVQRTVDLYEKQAEKDATSGNFRMTRRHASFCGGQDMILTPELATKLVQINDQNWGKLSITNLQANWQLKDSLAVWLPWINGSNCLVQHVNGGTSSPSLPLGIVLIVCLGCSTSTKRGERSLWTTPLGTVMRNGFIWCTTGQFVVYSHASPGMKVAKLSVPWTCQKIRMCTTSRVCRKLCSWQLRLSHMMSTTLTERSEYCLLPWCEKRSAATQGRELPQGKLTSSRLWLSRQRSTGKLCCRRTDFWQDAWSDVVVRKGFRHLWSWHTVVLSARRCSSSYCQIKWTPLGSARSEERFRHQGRNTASSVSWPKL